MCLVLTFPYCPHVPRDLLFVTIFLLLSLAGRAHLLGMWDATFKLVFINLLARLDFS